jgi:hypothetical protein
MTTLADGLFQRETGTGRWKAAGADRGDVTGRECTAVPGVQRAVRHEVAGSEWASYWRFD